MHQARTAWPVTTRVSYVVAFEHLRRQHPRLSGRQFCAATEIPYATFARWWARFRQEGNHALLDRSKRPRHSPTALAGTMLDIIRQAHRTLGIGVRRLHATLRADRRISCSASSVYRVLGRAGALLANPPCPTPLWQRYAKERPGERTQIDLKYLPQGRYQFTVIDDCSRMLAATVLPDRTMATVAQALPRLLDRLPFPVTCVQSDNGPEFQRAVTAVLRARGIRHSFIRPRCPHLNGKVERVQRTCQEEFWDGIDPDGPLTDCERHLQAYVHFYNTARLHSALGYDTPARVARRRLAHPSLSHLS
jgi:transposase InsO family protein